MGEKKAEQAPPPVPTPAAAIPQAPKPLTSRSVFSHPEAHPLSLDMVLLKNFELEWLTWLPDTLFYEIETTFTTSIAEVNKLKILATQTLHVVDTYWESWEIFEKSIWALNGAMPIVNSIQPPDLPMLFAGIDMANSIRQEKYGDEVARYCAAVFLHENVFYAPEPLSFCQEFITQPYYICHDCDKHASSLPPFDGMCTSCGGHYTTEHPFSMKPSEEAVRKGLGRNLTFDKTYDSDPIKARFNQLNSLSGDQIKSAIGESYEDIQSAKLITAVDFMKYRSQQLAEQLTSLRGWLEME